MNILVLSSLYPSPGSPKAATPVVHYFTREWVKLGHNVLVIHYATNFPILLRLFLKLFKGYVISRAGYDIQTNKLKDLEFELGGVRVKRIMLKKSIPHSEFSKKQIEIAFQRSLSCLSVNKFNPDIIISHWPSPQIEIMNRLNENYKVKTCYVCHGFNEMDVYKERISSLLGGVSVIGFRSKYIKNRFEDYYRISKPSFICSSGIPNLFLTPVKPKDFSVVSSFIFIGTMIKRKYPTEALEALCLSYGSTPFHIDYIGEGSEKERIRKVANNYNCQNNVSLLGRVDRSQIVDYMDKNQVFIMISKNETFGLVYLEAMSRGCITIASRGEGFDGIIEDGINGFLCEAGNKVELSQIINKIKGMDISSLVSISNNARKTAEELTDTKVAMRYLDSIININ